MKNRKREICTSGTVRDEDGNILIYSAAPRCPWLCSVPASFRPKSQIAKLRAHVRQRARLLEYAASHIPHMQKALTEMDL
jgi:hypothetical protein